MMRTQPVRALTVVPVAVAVRSNAYRFEAKPVPACLGALAQTVARLQSARCQVFVEKTNKQNEPHLGVKYLCPRD